MTMPLWATIASVFVACVPPVQKVLDNHMGALTGAIASAGNASIPLTLVVLGAYFYVPPAEGGGGGPISTSRSTDSLADSARDLLLFKKKPQGRQVRHSSELATPGETKTVAIAVLSRMVITPSLLMPLIAASAKFDWHKMLDE